MTMGNGKCECCNEEKELIGVASIPFIPMSIAWCQDCINANVIPYWAAVANTACCDGLDNTNEEWKEWVKRTLKYFNKTDKEFKDDVDKSIKEMETQNG